MKNFRIGVDTGGTFTDFVVIRDGKIEMFKELSTPQQPENAIMKGIEKAGISGLGEVIHGSTVATNALLERKGACAALITTEGFADVLEIGRQDRPALYDIMQQRPPALIPRERRLELHERLDYRGTVLCAPTTEDYEELIQKLMDCE